jgi:hypothetical protein
MTPVSGFLDPAWDRSVDIHPGMVAMRAGGDLFTLIDATGVPFGFFGVYIGGNDIDEPLDAGINAVPVWVPGGPDAQFEVDAPAFDDSLTWTDPVDGTELLVHAYESGAKRGRLCPAGTALDTAQPVARLIKVNSDATLTLGGLRSSGTYS